MVWLRAKKTCFLESPALARKAFICRGDSVNSCIAYILKSRLNHTPRTKEAAIYLLFLVEYDLDSLRYESDSPSPRSSRLYWELHSVPRLHTIMVVGFNWRWAGVFLTLPISMTTPSPA